MSEPNSLFSQLILIDISSTINFQKICQFGVHRVVKTNPLRVTYKLPKSYSQKAL